MRCLRLISLLLGMVVAGAGSASGIGIPIMYKNVGDAHGVPGKLLLAIGLTESYWSKSKKYEPWPWTLNVAGDGMYFMTKEDMLDSLAEALFSGNRSIDIGSMQLNTKWQHTRFSQLIDMAQPVDNLNVAAIILLENREVCGGDWWCAVGAYHSSNPARAEAYINRVKKWLDRIE